MKKLTVILGLLPAGNAASAMTEWEQYCRTEAFVVQELQMLRTTVYLDKEQATKEVVTRLGSGDYKQFGIVYDPVGVPYLADSVFYNYDQSVHHLEASQQHFESCMEAEAGEGDECDGC